MSKGNKPPKGRKHGPKKRKILIDELMEKVLTSEFLDEWKTSTEIAEEVNKSMSNFWSPVTTNVVSQRMPRFLHKCKLKSRQFQINNPGSTYMIWKYRRL